MLGEATSARDAALFGSVLGSYCCGASFLQSDVLFLSCRRRKKLKLSRKN